MVKRVFGFLAAGEVLAAYDPCTGRIHNMGKATIESVSRRVLYDEEEVVEAELIEPWSLNLARPVSICWSPVVACNLNCPHCLDDKFLSEGNRKNRLLLAATIGSANLTGVDISGGEPLSLPEIGTLAQILSSQGLAVSVTTNGWLLSDKIKKLVGKIDAIRVSLDGSTPSLHDRLRGQDSFVRALKGLRAAIGHGVPVQLHTVLMRSTEEDIQNVVHIASEEGAKGVSILQLLPIGEARALFEQESVSDDEAQALFQNLKIPKGLSVRVRKRSDADGFCVVRADGSLWRNRQGSSVIERICSVKSAEDFNLSGQRDGSA